MIPSDAPKIYVSPRIEEVLGVTQEAYLANPNLWRELVHPEDRAWMFETYRRTLEAGETIASAPPSFCISATTSCSAALIV